MVLEVKGSLFNTRGRLATSSSCPLLLCYLIVTLFICLLALLLFNLFPLILPLLLFLIALGANADDILVDCDGGSSGGR